MESSTYFQKTIFYEQSPAALDYWETRVQFLFVTDESKSWLDVYSNTPKKGSITVTTADRQSTTCISDHRTTSLPYDESPSYVAAMEGRLQPSKVAPNNREMSRQEAGLCLRRLQHTSELLKFLSTRRDGFRIFIIRQRNSFSRLNITQELFDLLIWECRIFPQFKDFVLCFGVRHRENEAGYPPLIYRLEDYSGASDSGMRFECAYVLRFMELNHRQNERDPWSLRQSGIYHQYTAKSQSSTWLFISVSGRAQARIETYLEASNDIQLFDPFEVHLLLLDTAMANWRPYLVHITTEIDEQADRVVMASIESDGPIRITEFEERQQLKLVEDKILDLLIVMDSTLDTIDSLSKAYQEIWSTAAVQHLHKTNSEHDLIGFGLSEKRRDIILYRNKVQTLRSKVKSTTKLVASLLDFGNGRSLKMLAEETRLENVTMRRLTEKATQDAAAVKVLTIMTLVYLPATVVLNFFSTQFVNQVTSIDRSVHITVASNWWIFLAVSLPLTTITLYIWWFYVQKHVYGVYPTWWAYSRQTLQVALVNISDKLQRWRRRTHRTPD